MDSDFQRLRKQLRPRPFLVANGGTGEVRLLSESKAVRVMSDTGLFRSQVVMNAGKALENFAMLAGEDDRQFTLKDIATITGTPYSQAYGWLDEKVITPSIRSASGAGRGKSPLFSWRDAFVAGICGSLRRQGMGLDVLRNVSPLFNDTKEKRTARKESSSKRS